MCFKMSARRFVCLDFETNGFPPKTEGEDWPLPFHSYPIQLSVDVVEDGAVAHHWDTLMCGATQLCTWVQRNVPLTLPETSREGIPLGDAVLCLDLLLKDGDTIVIHNADFDINMVLRRSMTMLQFNNNPHAQNACGRIIRAPRFCTMKSVYARSVFGKWPKLRELCDHFEVQLTNAHDARGDSKALADCVVEAMRRGVMLNIEAFIHERSEARAQRDSVSACRARTPRSPSGGL